MDSCELDAVEASQGSTQRSRGSVVGLLPGCTQCCCAFRTSGAYWTRVRGVWIFFTCTDSRHPLNVSGVRYPAFGHLSRCGLMLLNQLIVVVCIVHALCSMKHVVLHASDEGNYAREHKSLPNGYFTGALLRAIKSRGHLAPIMELLDAVAEEVKSHTDGMQKPTPVGTVGHDVFFVDLHGGRLLCGTNPTCVRLRTVVEPLRAALEAHIKQRSSELHYYIEPAAVVGSLPPGATTALELVTNQESRSGAGLAVEDALLSDAALRFLGNGHQTLLVLGDAGGGKSTFMMQLGQRLLSTPPGDLLNTPVSRLPAAAPPILLPVYVELKLWKTDGLEYMLKRTLVQLGLSEAVVDALRSQNPVQPLVRVVLLADGFDELQGDSTCVHDFVGTTCPGWDPALLAVVVTSRESRVGDRLREDTTFGAGHERALLLPFSKQRVRSC